MDDRRDDWRSGVDEKLVSLTTAQRVTDKEIEDLDVRCEAIDKIVRGDPEHDRDGIVDRQHQMETLLNSLRAEFNAIRQKLDGYADGSPGIEKRLERMEDTRERADKWWTRIFDFGGRLIVELLILATTILLNWDRIEGFFKHEFQYTPTKVEKMMDEAENPHPHHRKVKHIIVVKPEPEPDHESSADELQ